MTPFYVDQDSFQPKQRTGVNSDAITRRQIWPGLVRYTRCDQCLYGLDFRFIDCGRAIVKPNDLDHTRRLQYRKPILRIETAEQISREQRRIDFFNSVRPALPQFV